MRGALAVIHTEAMGTKKKRLPESQAVLKKAFIGHWVCVISCVGVFQVDNVEKNILCSQGSVCKDTNMWEHDLCGE